MTGIFSNYSQGMCVIYPAGIWDIANKFKYKTLGHFRRMSTNELWPLFARWLNAQVSHLLFAKWKRRAAFEDLCLDKK